MDEDDERVYKYDTAGNDLGSFTLRNENDNASGITTDGSKIWVVDRSDDVIYEHEMDGSIPPKGDTPSPGLAVDLISNNGDARGIARTSTGFFVVDHNDDEVYSYDIWRLSGPTVKGYPRRSFRSRPPECPLTFFPALSKAVYWISMPSSRRGCLWTDYTSLRLDKSRNAAPCAVPCLAEGTWDPVHGSWWAGFRMS